MIGIAKVPLIFSFLLKYNVQFTFIYISLNLSKTSTPSEIFSEIFIEIAETKNKSSQVPGL